jgi:RimJ/RimL family protein N-acetyltransferase
MVSNWIEHPTYLQGQIVDLFPLEREHFPALELLAKDARIWEFYAYNPTNSDTFKKVYDGALLERDAGTRYPFVVVHKARQRIIGSTQLMDIQPKHKKLEIGTTWLLPDYWATAVNLECKLLLLTFCFEHLQTLRVQLKTDATNLRSRKAIEKIGGQFEGILRNDILRDNGTHRHSAYFSIIETEWSEQKTRLVELLKDKMEV